ncbi:MAG: hypothetical protein H7259_07220, partial [Cytophagales bacterium]|nr:hypothetical protein [Cytophaga sp.]
MANAQPEFLYPLIDAELNLKDIVDPNKKNLNITENSDGYYTFIYYENVFDQYITDYLKIADLSISQSASLTVVEIASPVAGTVSHSFSNNFTLQTSNGEQLKNIKVKSGTIPLTVSSTFTASLQLAITFPYIKKNGIALSKTITLAGNGSFTDNIDLTGYNIDLTKGSTTFNTISYDAVLNVTVVPGNTITPAQKVSILTGIQNIAYSYADGYIGKYALTIPKDTLSIDIFNTAYAGNVFFSDPKVSAIIFNSVGVPATVKINSLATLSNISGYTLIAGSKINVDIPIEYPLLPSEPGKTTTIQLDKTNSNVQTVF